jgi:phosphate-selective porin OprO/OprP
MRRRQWAAAAHWLVAGTAVLLLAPAVRADDNDLQELRRRVEKLEQQNEQLRNLLENIQGQWAAPTPAPAVPPAGDSSQSAGEPASPTGQQKKTEEKKPEEKKEKDSTTDKKATKAKKEDEEKKDTWFEVGKDLGVKATWENYQLWFATADRSFRFHVSGRLQADSVWADADRHVADGKGGTGNFHDGVDFRRARLGAEGWMYEVFDFYVEADFTQRAVNVDPTMPADPLTNIVSVPTLTEAYGSVNYLPWLGTVRFGNQKPPILLEHLTSGRFLDFLERSSIFDVYFNRSNGFEPGIEIDNWTEDERLTWQLGFFANEQTIEPFSVGGGNYQVNGRLTALPWYEDEGRYMIHLGLGLQYDEPEQGTAVLRDHWLLRNGTSVTQNIVSQATLNSHHQFLAVPEFFMNLGPLSIQAEYLANHLDDISSFATQAQGTVAVKGSPKNFFSQGAYVEVMYFLTGEYRPFERTPLHAGGARPTRIVPLRNFFWVPGEGCPNPFSSGAWQVGARYSYSDLTNNGINGGQINEVTLGLNWFLNPNMKIQWNYDVGYRGQLGPGSSSNGTYQGFGTRLAFDF